MSLILFINDKTNALSPFKKAVEDVFENAEILEIFDINNVFKICKQRFIVKQINMDEL